MDVIFYFTSVLSYYPAGRLSIGCYSIFYIQSTLAKTPLRIPQNTKRNFKIRKIFMQERLTNPAAPCILFLEGWKKPPVTFENLGGIVNGQKTDSHHFAVCGHRECGLLFAAGFSGAGVGYLAGARRRRRIYTDAGNRRRFHLHLFRPTPRHPARRVLL